MKIAEALGLLATGAFVGAWVANYVNYQQFERIVDSWAGQTSDEAENFLRDH